MLQAISDRAAVIASLLSMSRTRSPLNGLFPPTASPLLEKSLALPLHLT